MSTGRTEEELARDLRAGSADALAALFDRYADRVYNHCFR